jgi:hypothetical protein
VCIAHARQILWPYISLVPLAVLAVVYTLSYPPALRHSNPWVNGNGCACNDAQPPHCMVSIGGLMHQATMDEKSVVKRMIAGALC